MQTEIAAEFAGTADGAEAEAILRKCVHCGFCTATCPTYQLLGDELIEWHGAQRWLATALPAAQVRDAAAAVGGHATAFRTRDKSAGAFMPLTPPLARIHRELKQSFDPAGLFNRGRLYPGL